MDIPLITPKTTLNNKNEFYVDVQNTTFIDRAYMKLFPKVVLKDWEQGKCKELLDDIKSKNEELDVERQRLRSL